MKTENLINAQIDLYRWMGHFEKRSRRQIKEVCEYLNIAMDLRIKGSVLWELFYPLVYNGVIDHVSNDYWAITAPISLEYDNHDYLINFGDSDSYCPVGFCCEPHTDTRTNLKHVRLSSIKALKKCPSIKDVVASWERSLIDVDELEFHNTLKNKGVAQLRNNENRKFFAIPEQSFIREIPDFNINPDARNIGQYYERVINGESNGFVNDSTLHLQAFGLSFILYRILIIDGLAIKKFPQRIDDYVVFYNLRTNTIHELNRILCNSVKYE